MKKLIGVLIILIFIGCNTKDDCSYERPIDINDGLSVSTLEEHKLDTAIFNKLNQDICNGKYGNVHSLLVIDNSDLVIEQYYNKWEKDRLHILASNTKSFNSLLIGVAIEQGYIDNVDQRMLDFFPEYENLKKDTLKNKITIKDLLTMTSGFKWDEHSLPLTDPNNMGRQIDKTEDWLKSSLELSMDTVPGTKYVYSGPNNIILSEIIKRSTGKNIAEFAEEYLFEPLGIKEYNWISKNGIEEIFSPFIEIHNPVYGCYQWRMVRTEHGFNTWFIPGNGGQIINIIPELDMVIVINADNREIPKDRREPLEFLIKNIIKISLKLKQ